MSEFLRYTFLVLLGLCSILTLFMSIAFTGVLVAQSGEMDTAVVNVDKTIYYIWGIMAFGACLWLLSTFTRGLLRSTMGWFNVYRENIATYSVISLIFIVFVIS